MKTILKYVGFFGLSMTLTACHDHHGHPPIKTQPVPQSAAAEVHYGPPPAPQPTITVIENDSPPPPAVSVHYGPPASTPVPASAASHTHYGPPTPATKLAPAASNVHYGAPDKAQLKKKRESEKQEASADNMLAQK